jgi:hypothetical protein
VLAQMQVELQVHLVCRDTVLQAARTMFHCAFDTRDANSFLYLGSLSKQSGGSSRSIDTTQISYLCDLPVSMGDRLLHRDIWEAVYHRLGVPALRMILETDNSGASKGIRYVTPSGSKI